ncbi:MAG: glycosyltransferase [Nitrosomonadales bacterium]|nr:MAG: glycosyltransferase [Nitrosomonadales bacterium]
MKFVLLFRLANVHLLKDAGMIPYLLGKQFGWDTEIVGNRNDTSYPYLKEPLADLAVTFLTGKIGREPGLETYAWLWKNAKKIDVLMLFHIRTTTIYQMLLYKLRHPRGYVYVKADVADERIGYAGWGGRNIFTQFRRRILFSLFVKHVDLVSFECLRTFAGVTNIPASKKIHVANGVWRGLNERYGVSPVPFEQKKNRIILVARHGTHQKNSELILDALNDMAPDALKDWEICFAGSATADFMQKLAQCQQQHPCGKNVHYLGEIVDRKKLLELYQSSKIFVMPSRSESWGIACCEALYFGNVPVMTRELSSSPDLTDDGRAGLTFPNENAKELAARLQFLVENPEQLKQMSEHARAYAAKNFVWEDIVQHLGERIQNDLARLKPELGI